MSGADDPQATSELPGNTQAIDARDLPTSAPVSSHPGSGGARFGPGAMVAGRYRIVSLLGAGGMGEVYRAEDLRLGHSVALKFLPPELAADPRRLAMLHAEVRVGRQVSHPNVCRLHDVGDWEGHAFLSMEYVEGEDLARLLRRIGRLPSGKASEVARGICAGLAAAHAKGVIHRDLKPANVMIDGHGEPRLTDFGLAIPAESSGQAVQAGTPAYLAPEQFDGQPASVRTDIYALGLVLYELFTGKPAHAGRTISELREQRRALPAPPSSRTRELDKSVDAIVLRCLAIDPAQRPASVREVLAAFPAEDPLEAAVAAGQTPSPRSVAAAPKLGTLAPAPAWALLGLVIAGLGGCLLLGPRVTLVDLRPRLSAPVLWDRAQRVAQALGRDLRSPVCGFEHDRSYMAWLAGNAAPAERLERLRSGPPSVLFWCRSDPVLGEGLATYPERLAPPLSGPGTFALATDLEGRLVSWLAVPDGASPPRDPDWPALLRAAGLDPAALQPARPEASVPPVAFDSRLALSGRHPGDGTLELRIEAAAFQGAPVFFDLGGSWKAGRTETLPFSSAGLAAFQLGVALLAVLGAALLAWSNLRARRGDLRGAAVVATVLAATSLLESLLLAAHAPGLAHELEIVQRSLSGALFLAACGGVLYLAVEPHLRRRWPQLLVSWARAIGGDLRDPLVGRDLLLGLAAGLVHASLAYATNLTLGNGKTAALFPLQGLLGAFATIVSAVSVAILEGLFLVVVLTFGLVLFRSRAASAALLFGIYQTFFVLAFGRNLVGLAFGLLIALFFTFLIPRTGLLTAAAAAFAFRAGFVFPLAWDASPQSPALALGSVLVLAVLGFRIALGGRPALALGED